MSVMDDVIHRCLDLVAAGMDETKDGYVIANCKSQDVLVIVPPMQKTDAPEAPDGRAAKRAMRPASFMALSLRAGRESAPLRTVEHKQNKKGIQILDMDRGSGRARAR